MNVQQLTPRQCRTIFYIKCINVINMRGLSLIGLVKLVYLMKIKHNTISCYYARQQCAGELYMKYYSRVRYFTVSRNLNLDSSC